MVSKRAGLVVSICLFLLALDIFVKAYTVAYIPPMNGIFPEYPYGGIGVFRDFLGVDFSLNYTKNTGAAWGLFASYQTYLLVLRLVIMAGMGCYLFLAKLPFKKFLPLSLVFTGALGNILDFFLYGHVVDMFCFRLWGYIFPIFNIADCAISVGVAILFFVYRKKGVCKTA